MNNILTLKTFYTFLIKFYNSLSTTNSFQIKMIIYNLLGQNIKSMFNQKTLLLKKLLCLKNPPKSYYFLQYDVKSLLKINKPKNFMTDNVWLHLKNLQGIRNLLFEYRNLVVSSFFLYTVLIVSIDYQKKSYM